MSAPYVSAVSTQATISDKTSHCSIYKPDIWGDHFLSYTTNHPILEDEKAEKQIQELKEKVKKMLLAYQVEKISSMFDLIETIQRLGISYHFETEIEQVLKLLLPVFDQENDNDDLYTISLGFRLFRQHGYKVSCDAFEKFKNKNGSFKESIVNDVKGLLSLYEASHLMVHGEDILEEALAFTVTHLQATLPKLGFDTLLSKMIQHAFKQSIHRNIPRLEARCYLSIYEQDPMCNEQILTLAKLDFNMLQKQHQKEIADITRWYKNLDFRTKLPFARDRVVECYLIWALGVYFEPKYSLSRKTLTKMVYLASIIDDIYDVFGTHKELTLFTDAIERWQISAIDKLPEYMKVCFQALLDLFYEVGEKLTEQAKYYRLHYAKEAMKIMVRAYFEESKWLHYQYTPTMDEYMMVALSTTAYSMLTTTSLLGMGDIVTEDTFKWVFSSPKIIKAACTVCRLMDDIVSHKFEQEREHVPSAIECYMKQYGATEEEAHKELQKQIKEAWNDINQEFLHPTCVPLPILTQVLNLARAMDVVYKEQDGYTEANIKDIVSSLLIHPIPMQLY